MFKGTSERFKNSTESDYIFNCFCFYYGTTSRICIVGIIMLVEKGSNGYTIIMADSGISEVVIRLKQQAAIELRDKLDMLIRKTEEEDIESWEEEKLRMGGY